MSPWRQLTRGLRALLHRSHTDRDIADEVQHYLEEATAAHVARGLSLDQAVRAARLEVGSLTGVKEEIRGYGWENAIETLLADLRFAARRLRADPGFTIVALLTLALGIGGTTAIFSAVNPILFQPLPYPHADRLTAIWEVRDDGGRNDGTFGMARALSERSRSFESIALFRLWQPTVTGPDQPERFDAQRVSASYFRVLGISPIAGRDFQLADDRLDGARVVVISDGLWRRRFGADRAIVGREITLDDNRWTIVGVMPPDFENVLAPSAELWAPLQYDMSQGRAWGHHLRTIGRLRPGLSLDRATRELDALGNAVIREHKPETYDGEVRFVVPSLHADVTRGVRQALLAILGAIVLVLVIACVNVANLLLARGVQRRGEFALRAALGAGRGRLVRQLLTESLLLAVMGGIVGMVVAVVGVRAIVALGPSSLPRLDAIGVDGTAMLFASTLAVLSALSFGMWPALHAWQSDPNRHLQQDSRRSTAGHRRARGALVVAEVAIALVLLVSSGLLLRSLDRLFAVPVGFDSSQLLTMQVVSSRPGVQSDSGARRLFEATEAAVRRVPGVTAAAFTSQLPLSGDRDEYGVRFEPSADGYSTFRYAVSPGYVETMRIPLRLGRTLDERDRAGAPLVALISESLAKRQFPNADPIGHRLGIGPIEGYTIVGVVGDVKQMSLALSESEAVYIPMDQWAFADNAMSLVVRARDPDAAALAPAIRAAVWSVDKDQPVVRVATMDGLLAASAAERRFALILFEAFALAALVLAAAGIYGVLAGSVAERTREIGVRSALGASRSSIIAMVLRQGLSLAGLGVAIGLAGAFAATQAIAALLFGVSAMDPVTYAGVIALLGVVSLIACGVPAWRASRLDPASTLRAD
jgi:putative ABC transport system permease protein